tara:strand:- start:167 stop:337 length:171 start_codon:yes stop_codon:yes gene_type:complete
MYKLKKQYKGVELIKNGRLIRLDTVKSNEVKLLGLEIYFTKSKKDKKSKDPVGSKL